MCNNIDVTITTINWNVTQELQNCIDSFLNTYKELKYEWYIFDNNSHDADFNEVVNKYSNIQNIKFIINDRNEGLAVLNKIINKIKGRYWLFLDPDTLQKGKPIVELIKFMDSNPKAGISTAKQFRPDGLPYKYYSTRYNISKVFFLYTRLGRLIDHVLFKSKMVQYHSYYHLDLRKVAEIDTATFACTIERAKLILEDRYVIDPEFSFWFNDVDLCQRVRDKGYKVYMVPNAEIIHNCSSSYNKRKILWKEMEREKNQIKYFRKHHKYKVWLLKIIIISNIFISIIDNLFKGENNKKLFWKIKNMLIW